MNTQRLILSTATCVMATMFLAGVVYAQAGPGGPPDFARGGPPEFTPGGPPEFRTGGPPETLPGRDDGGDRHLPPGLDPDFTPPGAGNDDDENHDDDNGIPPFCSSEGADTGPSGQAGLSSIAHLNFSSQDGETGDPVDEGPWGRMMYRWIAPVFDFVFNGHELTAGDEYTLTYQPQPLPSEGVICLGSAAVNPGGNLHLQDAFDIGTDLPAAWDANEDEAILALVLTADVDCDAGEMIEWQPENYLFGEEMMFYVHSELVDDYDDDDGET